MAFVLADRVRDTTTTTGTGTVTLSGTAPTGYQTFGDGIGNGNNTYYTINADTQWEVGIGTYTASGTTLSRNTVLASSNGGALVDFAIGTKNVFVDYPAEKAVTDIYGTALAATTAANLASGAAGSIPYQTAANTTAMLATGTGVLIGGTTPSYTMSPSLTQVTVAGDPTVNLQVATKQYVDTIAASGVTYHTPVKYEVPVTTGNLNALYNQPGGAGDGVGATLTNNGAKAAFAPDGPTASVGDRILIYNQTSAFQNGVYTVTTVGTPDPGGTNWVLTRATDADTYGLKDPDALGQGDAFFVTSGNTGAGETYVCNTLGTITFGSTAITFAQVSSAQVYSAGTGLTLTNTVFSLTAPVATTLGGTGLTAFTSGGAVYATSTSTLTTGTLPATAGGTGQSSYTTGDLLYASSSTALSALADVATGNALISGGVGTAPSWGKIGLTTHVSGTLAVANGGTGATSLTGYLKGNGTSAFTTTATIPTSDLSGTISLTTQVSGTLGAGNGGTGISSYTVGDILYASATTTLSTLADVATGNALISGGVSNPPSWGKIGLTTHVSGTLPVSNGGSGATTLTGYLKGNGTSAFTASATIPAGDITGAALTKADDTNVTLTLGGSPSTALLAATSITAGWTGQLAVSRGGTGNSTLASGYLLKGNGVSPTSASVVYDDGTNAGVGTTSLGAKWDVKSQINVTSPSNISMNAVRASNFGYSTGYSALIVGSTSGNNTPCINVDPIANPSGAFGGLGNEVMFRNGAYFISPNSANTAYNQYLRLIDGYVQFTNSARAPIFYDSDNTAYYMDLTSSTSLNAAGSLVASGNITLNNGANRYVRIGSATNYSYDLQTTGDDFQIIEAGTTPRLTIKYPSGNLGVGTASPSARITAQVNSGNYILDLINGSETGFALRTYNHGSGSAPGLVFTQGLYYNTTENASIKFYRGGGVTGGYLGFTVSDGTERLTINSSGNVTANVDMRAPIFYDSNNTAFYADMAGTSNFNQINLGDSTKSIRGGASGQVILGTGGVNEAYIQVGGSYYSIWNAGNFTPGNYMPISGGTFTGAVTFTGGSLVASDGGIRARFNNGNTGAVYFGSGDNYLYYDASNFILNGGYVSNANSFRAPIFYDSNNTGYYGDFASTSVLNNLITVGAVSNDVGGLRNVNPGGGSYVTSTPSVSGAIKIKLPQNVYPMLRFTVRVFTYDEQSFDIYCGGHTSSGQWYNTFAYMGTASRGAMNVRFTGDGTNVYVYIGDLGSNWNYPQVFITDVQVGYTNYEASRWDDGWVISFDASTYNTVYRTYTVFTPPSSPNNANPLYASTYYDSANTGYYVDPASSSLVNQIYYAGLYNSADGNYGVVGANGFFDTVNSGYDADALELCYVRGSEVRIGTGGGNKAIRASIFYEGTNTAYYVDPNAGSNVLGDFRVNQNGAAGIQLLSTTGTQSLWIRTGYDGAPTPSVSATNVQFQSSGSSGGSFTFYSGNTLALTINGDHATGNGSLRAPIFYDSGNTGYYVDPNYISQFWRINAADYIYTSSDVYGKRFIDIDNQNYYCDPNGTSVLNSVAGYTLRNIEDVSVDTQYGIYFSSNFSTAYAIYREAGAWTHPYPDLRIAFHTGIKMGANAGYGGMKFYTDYDMTTQVMSINNSADGLGGGYVFVNDALQAGGSLRAPIFYDSNNTGYYLDASSTGTSLNVAGSIVAAGNVTAYSDIRIKGNVETIPSALDKLDQIRGVTYTRTDLDDKEQRYAGVIAQEIEAVLPEAVRDLGDIKAVDYNATIGLLIQAVKELTDKVKALEAKEQ